MSLRYYPEPGLRPRSDTDLFVSQENFSRCCEVLESAGYVYIPPEAGEQVMSTATYEKSARFDLSLVVDLHQAITSSHHPYRDFVTFEGLWKESRTIDGMPGSFRVPSEEFLLLHACFHGAQHFAHLHNRLIWLYDIALLINELGETALQAVWRTATELKLGSVVAFFTGQGMVWCGSWRRSDPNAGKLSG